MAAAPGAVPPTSPAELERLKGLVGRFFPVYETRVAPFSLLLMVHVDPVRLEGDFDALRRELWPLYYVPQIRQERGEHVIEIVRRPTQNPWGGTVNLLLLGATVVSTVFAGAFLWVAYRGGAALGGADLLWGGVYFAAPLMLILGLHELAHYLMARRHHVDASLPYFLPVPPPFLIFGTFGAFISLREPFPDKKALLDIGVAGPIMGFVVAIPVTLLGLHLSAGAPVLSAANCGPSFFGFSYGNLLVGTPAIWAVFNALVPGGLANLHPLALAGWVGILVTAFNLLPAGQLDGGHVARALLGKQANWASWGVLGILIVLGFEFYFGWLIFAIFIFLVGMRHPPPLNDLTPIGWPRRLVGVGAVAILVGGFTLVPLATPTGDFQLEQLSTASVTPLPLGAAMADNISFTVVNQDVVDHAYNLSGSIDSVVASQNGTTRTLNGSALASFAANASWIVRLPDGSVRWFNHTGAFSIPRSAFTAIPASGGAPFVVMFESPLQATVNVAIVVTQLCPTPGVPNTQDYRATIY